MIITAPALEALKTGFATSYNKGFTSVPPLWPQLAMKITSHHSKEAYGWMEQIPSLREWVGPRVVNGLKASGYIIENRDFEQTISVPRNSIQDDQAGLFSPLFEEMGRAASEVPDKLITELMLAGFTTDCYDGQTFFDTDHPVVGPDNTTVSVSNFGGGSGEPWFLLDTTRAIRPFVYQERTPFNRLDSLDKPNDPNVFFNKEFIYGTDGRGNAGFGLWQLAYGSKGTLDATSYAAARAAMLKMVGDQGRKLGIRPTTLVVGPSNESAARKLLKTNNRTGGESNEWQDSAELIVSAWI